MEKAVVIPINSKRKLHGLLRGSLKGKKPILVFLHGLTDSMNAHCLFNGARVFESKGYASLRYNQYGWEKDTPSLRQSTLTTLSRDFVKVIDYLKSKTQKPIVAVGHSIGASIILKAQDPRLDGIVFWDGTYQLGKFLSGKVTPGAGCIQKWGTDILLSEKFVKEAKNFTNEVELVKSINCPKKLIYTDGPGGGALLAGARIYYSSASKPKSLSIVKGADHNFNRDKSEEKLFKLTSSWLKQYF